MGKGLGATQLHIINALNGTDGLYLTVTDLAESLKRSPRQVQAAVHALEARGVVVVGRGYLGLVDGRPTHGLMVMLPENRSRLDWYFKSLERTRQERAEGHARQVAKDQARMAWLEARRQERLEREAEEERAKREEYAQLIAKELELWESREREVADVRASWEGKEMPPDKVELLASLESRVESNLALWRQAWDRFVPPTGAGSAETYS